MPVELKFARGVTLDVRPPLRAAVAYLRKEYAPHTVHILVRPEPCIAAGDGAFLCFGLFARPVASAKAMRGKVVQIVVAAGMADTVMESTGDSRAGGIEAVAHTLMHEWVHYTQWRDGRPAAERGVNLRARTLCRKAGLLGGAAAC